VTEHHAGGSAARDDAVPLERAAHDGYCEIGTAV
jgi:hypothetical protein